VSSGISDNFGLIMKISYREAAGNSDTSGPHTINRSAHNNLLFRCINNFELYQNIVET
jgi:hypothetical protein